MVPLPGKREPLDTTITVSLGPISFAKALTVELVMVGVTLFAPPGVGVRVGLGGVPVGVGCVGVKVALGCGETAIVGVALSRGVAVLTGFGVEVGVLPKAVTQEIPGPQSLLSKQV